MSASFEFLVYTPAGHADGALAIAASRAGATGVLNAEVSVDPRVLAAQLRRVAQFARGPFGLRIDRFDAGLAGLLAGEGMGGMRTLVLTPGADDDETGRIHAAAARGVRILYESPFAGELTQDACPAASGLIVKGHEAGGLVSEETSFILLQRLLDRTQLPVYVRGGVGIHSAAAALVAGAAGAVLDSQLLLMRESPLRQRLEPLLRQLVGNETVAVGDAAAGRYVRFFERPGLAAARALREKGARLSFEEVRNEFARTCGWDDPVTQVMPLGQDAALAGPYATRYESVAQLLRALRTGLRTHLAQAIENKALDADSPLAQSHGTRYPIVQGPMTRVSDVAGFAEAVAREGGLPMLALALMRKGPVEALLEQTTGALAGRPWGIGLLGFAPADLLREQIETSRRFKPSFAILAGGRPDQALAFEQSGIATYLHVPSPRLLAMFVEQGARRFVFEGRECGGHTGPLASFVLWESMVDTLLGLLDAGTPAGELHILFAGGIHDTRSAAMVATLAAPLAARGVRIGVLMGSAYLFTREIVASGAVVPGFQDEALACTRTVNLETGPGHASRCADTAFAQQFLDLKQRLLAENRSGDEIREVLEDLNLGRLRLASKGKERNGEAIVEVGDERQHAEGMYMIGQVATLVSERGSVAQLHKSVTRKVASYLATAGATFATAETDAAPEVAQPIDVAIVGVGCVLPRASDARMYWENILDAVDGITEIPAARWDWRLYFDEDRSAPDKIYSRWGGFLDDMVFDPLRYGIPPRAIKAVDPMQLMTLEVVRQTLDDAGYIDREFDHDKVSIILGASGGAGDVGSQYAVRSETTRFAGELAPDVAQRLPSWTEDTFAGILLNVAAGRAANRFDFGGINLTVDAACASSLAAIYQACVELEDGRSDMVIAGGVDTVQGPFGYLCFSKTQALSPRGRCSTFDVGADGIVISEGIAMVALKRLADAERDGDRIYAVIKGVGGSSDGRARSMTAPHPDGQIRALGRAYRKAGYSPSTVGMFEAHGTGTVAGDTAELETVTRLLASAGAQPKQSVIGSVKTLIGHTKATAGVAGLVKAALSLHHRVLPPHSNVSVPNPKIADPASPLYLLREPRPWVTREGVARRAAVSAFGFGGTNFHVTLEEYQGDYLPDARGGARDNWRAELLVFRAADRSALAREVSQLAGVLERAADVCLRDVAYSAWRRAGKAHGETAAVVVEDRADAVLRLQGLAAHLGEAGQPLPPGAFYSAQPLAGQGKVALLCAGQGAQYPNMLREVAILLPGIAEVLGVADTVLAQQIEHSSGVGVHLSHLVYPAGLYSPEDEAAAARNITRTEIAQPALGAVEAGLWRLLQQTGLQVDMAAGHSFGEYVALYAAGVISLEDLLRVAEARGRFIVEEAHGHDLGTMAALPLEREAAEKLVSEHEGLTLANHNAPRQTIVSGPRDVVRALVEALNRKDINARLLNVAAAFHSPQVAPARDRLGKCIRKLSFASPRFPVYSNATAAPYPADPGQLIGVLTDHLVRPVEFVREIEAMYADGARIFVGLGPKGIQTGLAEQILGERPHRAVRLDDEQGGLKGLLQGLGMLLAEGLALDMEVLFRGRDCRQVDIANPDTLGRRVPPPAHAWLLNGSGARPINEPPAQPLTVEAVQQRRLAVQQATAQKISVSSRVLEETPMSAGAKKDPATAGPPVEIPADLTAYDRESVLAAYQATMRDFLRVQESVMLAYLGAPGRVIGRAGTRVPVTLTREAARVPEETVVEFRRGATAEPAVAAARPAAPVAPAAPAAPAAGAEAPATAAGPQPQPAPAPAPAAPAAAMTREGISELLLGIVEDRTGYPRDMLGLEQNMEADLGIDSIKRVEIVGALQKALPEDFLAGRGDVAGGLNAQKTLKGMIDWLAESPARQEAANAPFELTGTGAEESERRASLPRFIVEARQQDVGAVALEELAAGVWLVSEDRSGLAQAVAGELDRAGASPVLISVDDGGLEARLREARAQHGVIRGVVHLAGWDMPAVAAEEGLRAWRRATEHDVKSLFKLLQMCAQDLRDGGHVLAACGLGGTFSRVGTSGGLHAQGGSVGLLKSLREEWPAVRVKTVDLDPAMPVAANADVLVRELRLPGGRLEVGYPGGRRTVFHTVAADLDGKDASSRTPEPDWVVLATGGARGITAEVLRQLAPYGLHLVLVGRHPEPEPETEELAACTTEAALRAWFIGQAGERRPTPSEIERAVGAVVRDREIAANLRDLRAAGARVDYRVADVRDEHGVAALLGELYERHGRLDGLVHAAGIIEDKLLSDKSAESWDRVFDTKVDSTFLLASALRPETLKFAIFFTSVAGRYGNSGQTDYAAANELLNRMAWQLHARWGGRVKVAAINWGPWMPARYGRGMVTPETRRKFESRGVQLVDAAGGGRLFLDEIVRAPLQQVEVVAGEGPWERHEAETGALRVDAPAQSAQDNEFTALLGAVVHRTGPRGEIIVTRTIDRAHDPYLAEHMLDDVPVLPAAVATELMAEAAARAWPQWVVREVSDVRMLRGIRLETEAVPLEISALSSTHGDAAGFSAALEIRPAAGGPPHYRCTVHLASELPDAPRYEAVRQPGASPVTVQSAYRDLLFHGPCFQSMTRLHGLDKRGALVEVRSSSPSEWLPAVAPQAQWLFDPALVDAAPQLALVWAHTIRGESALPSRFGRIRRFGAGPLGAGRMHFLLYPEQVPHQVRADVAFVSEDGELRLFIEDLECTSSEALNRLGGSWKGEICV